MQTLRADVVRESLHQEALVKAAIKRQLRAMTDCPAEEGRPREGSIRAMIENVRGIFDSTLRSKHPMQAKENYSKNKSVFPKHQFQGVSGTARNRWHGSFCHGTARFDLARFDLVWHGTL